MITLSNTVDVQTTCDLVKQNEGHYLPQDAPAPWDTHAMLWL